MSRIGKKPVVIPPEIEITIIGGKVSAKGPKGELIKNFSPEISILRQNGNIVLKPAKNTLLSRRLWGTYRALINNMIEGVSKGFEKRLQIEGVGYRAEKQGENLSFKIGFSHPVVVKPSEGITYEVEKNTLVVIKGADKEKVGNEAKRICAIRPPDSYKGKGIRFENEILKLKPGKRVAATTGA